MAKKENNIKPTTTEAKSIVVQQLTVAQLYRGNQDVQTWINAVKSAESTRLPNRRPLYNTFLDVSIDDHLDSMMDKRIRAVKITPWEWHDLEDGDLKDSFNGEWFMELLKRIQERIFYGTTLLEFSFSSYDGLVEDVTMIPRQNVRPEKGIIMLDGYTEDRGIPYHSGRYPQYIMQVGRKDDLGKLTRLAPLVLIKRQNFSDWARYNEMYGIDMRVYEYDPTNPKARDEMEASAEKFGSAPWIVVPKGYGTITFPNSSNKQASAFAFDKLHEACNKAITIAVLGQTLTTGGEGGGSYELGKVHENVEGEINMEDRLYAQYLINYVMRKNILIPHGYPLEKIKGSFKVIDELPKEMKANMWVMLSKSGLPIAEEDFYNEFGVPFPEDRDVIKVSTPPPPPAPPGADPNAPPADDNDPSGGDNTGGQPSTKDDPKPPAPKNKQPGGAGKGKEKKRQGKKV